jgi:hypothetical protein
VSHSPAIDRFTSAFDDALRLCATAEVVIAQSAAAVARARQLQAEVRRRRALVLRTRDHLEHGNVVFSALRREVEAIASTMRDAGVVRDDAASAVRDRARFVLYDGGFREVDVEPVVARATAWVDEVFAAA